MSLMNLKTSPSKARQNELGICARVPPGFKEGTVSVHIYVYEVVKSQAFLRVEHQWKVCSTWRSWLTNEPASPRWTRKSLFCSPLPITPPHCSSSPARSFKTDLRGTLSFQAGGEPPTSS